MMLPMEKFKNDQAEPNALLSLVKNSMSTIKNQGMLPVQPWYVRAYSQPAEHLLSNAKPN